MITRDTPLHAIVQRRKERIAWDDTTLAVLGDGFNSTTFKARVLTSTYRPGDLGEVSKCYSRDEWDATGEQWSGEAGTPYGYDCPVCAEPIVEPQATEHTDEGLAHAECVQPDATPQPAISAPELQSEPPEVQSPAISLADTDAQLSLLL